jgi:hypothetical protein
MNYFQNKNLTSNGKRVTHRVLNETISKHYLKKIKNVLLPDRLIKQHFVIVK